MPTRTGTWNPNRSIGYMRTRKNASILREYLMGNGEHLPRWFLRQRVGWGNNALGFIVDWQSALPQRKKSNIPQPPPEKETKFRLRFCDLLSSVEEAPGTLSKFSVTRRTITLVLMLLKEPSLSSFYRQFYIFQCLPFIRY